MNSGGCPHDWVRTFSRVCLSHLINTAEDSALRLVHNSKGALRWGGVQQPEVERDFDSAAEITCFLLQHVNTKSFLDIFVCILYARGTLFSSLHICMVICFFVCGILETSSTSSFACSDSCGRSPASCFFYEGTGQRKSTESPELVTHICIFTYSPSRDSPEFSACLKAAKFLQLKI